MPRKPSASPSAQSSPAARGGPHEVRIIGGQWRRSRLPVADRPGLRPTPDRVRETLFNWLASRAGAGGGALPGWHCMDLFAGTGALGFEAASRGAASVLLCEQAPALAAQLKATRERLGAQAVQTVQVHRGDGAARLEGAAPASLHVVFVDPPFDQPALYARALRAVVPALRAEGVVYLEADQAWSDEALAPYGLHVLRHLRAGAVHAHLLAPRMAPLSAD